MEAPAAREHEEDLSDASLVEEEDEDRMVVDEGVGAVEAAAPRPAPLRVPASARSSTEEEGGSSAGSVIDLPGMPVTAPIEDSHDGGPSTAGDKNPSEMEVETSGGAPVVSGEVDRRIILPGPHEVGASSTNDPPEPDSAFRGWKEMEIGSARSQVTAKKMRFSQFVGEEEASVAEIYFAAKVMPQDFQAKNRRVGMPGAGNPRLKVVVPPPKPPALERRESREWRPSSMLFKPLTVGWVREVIYKQREDGTYMHDIKPRVVYHAPRRLPGTKLRQFEALQELTHYVNTAEPTLSWHNFSFRPDPMGAPPGQEVIRGENEVVEIFPPEPEKPKPPISVTPKQKAGKTSLATTLQSEVGNGGQGGGIKLKMFSKMKEKNQLNSPQDSPESKNQASSPSLTVSRQKRTSMGKHKGPHASMPSTSPSVSITPVGGGAASKTAAFGKPGDFVGWQQQQQQQRRKQQSNQQPSTPGPRGVGSGGKPILRPKKFNTGSCNIHCPGISGFPSLSCVSCQSMFHPLCVGLADGVNYESHYDFYCENCQPPPGKENLLSGKGGRGGTASSRRQAAASGSASPGGSGVAGIKDKFPPHGLPKGLSIIPSASARARSGGKSSSPVQYRQFNGVSGAGDAKKASFKPALATARRSSSSASSGTAASATPNSTAPAPVEAQSVVNIAGCKYLVVPQPTTQKNSSRGDFNKVGATSSNALSNLANSQAGKLLLKPADDGSTMPEFEVEETAEGKLVLVPLDKVSPANPFKKHKSNEEAKDTGSKVPNVSGGGKGLRGQNFLTNLNTSYFALMHVFKYLTLAEKLGVSRVCRLWKHMVYQPELWTTVSLKNVRVSDWHQAVAFLNKVETQRLDMRRMVHTGTPDETWPLVASAIPAVKTIRRLEFPRLSAAAIAQVIGGLPAGQLDELGANSLGPKDVDLAQIAKLPAAAGSLSLLRMRGVAGKLKLTTGLGPLGDLSTSLTKLSLLGVENMSPKDLDTFSSLKGLISLEIGDCSKMTDEVIKAATLLPELSSLRLEKAQGMGAALGELCELKLQKLELVDVVLREGFGDGLKKLTSLKKVLMIPQYKDEVATLNAEIVESVPSMTGLSHFFLGLTNEWLQSMSSLTSASATASKGGGGGSKDGFPIMVKGSCEIYSLSKLFKTLSTAMPDSRVKVLKMPQNATGKQFIDTLIR